MRLSIFVTMLALLNLWFGPGFLTSPSF
jgi:hypothetical protein